MAGWKEDRIGSSHRGENPMVMARMRIGFAVIGDTQHLPGYSLLGCDDASVDQLTGSTTRSSATRCPGTSSSTPTAPGPSRTEHHLIEAVELGIFDEQGAADVRAEGQRVIAAPP
jgi:hypothetical protein